MVSTMTMVAPSSRSAWTALIAEPPVGEEQPAPAGAAPLPLAPAPSVTPRCLLIGLALIPLNIYWVGMTEGIWHGLHFTCLSLPMTAVFYLLCLQALNGGLRRWLPDRAFDGFLRTQFPQRAG